MKKKTKEPINIDTFHAVETLIQFENGEILQPPAPLLVGVLRVLVLSVSGGEIERAPARFLVTDGTEPISIYIKHSLFSPELCHIGIHVINSEAENATPVK